MTPRAAGCHGVHHAGGRGGCASGPCASQAKNSFSATYSCRQSAESAHAKAHFDGPGSMDRADFEQCLVLCQQSGFNGPYSLIYDGPDGDEWAGLQLERAVVAAYL